MSSSTSYQLPRATCKFVLNYTSKKVHADRGQYNVSGSARIEVPILKSKYTFQSNFFYT